MGVHAGGKVAGEKVTCIAEVRGQREGQLYFPLKCHRFSTPMALMRGQELSCELKDCDCEVCVL